MSEILLEFVKSGALMAVLLLLFLVGFALKIMVNLCYDNALENLHCITLAKNGIVSDIIIGYNMNLKNGNKIRNAHIYVKNELHQWRKYGVRIERMEPLGDLFGEICLVVCAFFDMLLLTQRTFAGNNSQDIMRYVYVYTTISIIFFLVLKLWSAVTDSENKKKILADGLTNYIDNQIENIQDYVSLSSMAKDTVQEEKVSAEKSDGAEAMSGENKMNGESTTPVLGDKEDGEPLKKEEKERVISQVLDEFLV